MNIKSGKAGFGKLVLSLAVVSAVVAALYFLAGRAEKQSRPVSEPTQPKKVVFRSQLAGRWYPAGPNELSRQIKGFFDKAQIRPIRPRRNVIALILPHAGYAYSGQTAAFGLKAAQKKYKRIVVIGPSHNYRLGMENVLSVPKVTHYETPLGQIRLDTKFIDELLKHSLFQNIPQAHKNEHSVQIELPFLQYVQRDFKLVPIVAGRCSPKQIRKAGTILRGLVDNETLVIASSDFTHYGPRFGYMPFTENIPQEIKKLDTGAYKQIAAIDCEGFLEYKRRTGATICGYVPVAILLCLLADSTRAHLVHQTTSGEITGDFRNSVSYLSVLFAGQRKKQAQIKPPLRERKLTQEDKKQLLVLARRSLLYFLDNRRVPEPADLNIEISQAMSQPCAAFVTLNKFVGLRGENESASQEKSFLRGCIGDIFPHRPLYKSVIYNAINAGVNDRRFIHVTKDECNDIEIEISALTAPKPVESAKKIRVGVDGVVLSKNGRSAVFLPQVAPEQGWNLSRMLTQLSLKAGLPADAWKEGADFLVFQAVVFGEDEE